MEEVLRGTIFAGPSAPPGCPRSTAITVESTVPQTVSASLPSNNASGKGTSRFPETRPQVPRQRHGGSRVEIYYPQGSPAGAGGDLGHERCKPYAPLERAPDDAARL